jgi:hypothetical protein
MKPLRCLALVVVGTALLASGCASKNKGIIEGTKWDSLPTSHKGRPIPAGTLKLEFGSDHSLVYGVGGQNYTGTYSLGFGDQVTMKLNQELGGRKNHSERVVISGDQLTMYDSDGTQLTFAKRK